ncbi:MAG: hypothetical protein HYT16_02400 [DPANN group archaeon]|nr:hypothetical protein [DPANN group archaeon]
MKAINCFGKRSATEVLTVILLVMILVAVASVAGYWLTGIQQSQQGRTEQSQSSLITTLSSCLNFESFHYDTRSKKSDVVFENCGTTKLDVGDVRIGDLVQLSGPNVDPCSFTLNTTNCPACPFTLQPKSKQKFSIAWNAEPACSSRIVKGIKYQVSFFVDRLGTGSKTFLAQDEPLTKTLGLSTSCGIDVINATTGVNTPWEAKDSSYCFAFAVNKTGTLGGLITIQNTSTSGSCKRAEITTLSGAPAGFDPNRAACTETFRTAGTFGSPQSLASFGVYLTNSSAGGCNQTIQFGLNDCGDFVSKTVNFRVGTGVVGDTNTLCNITFDPTSSTGPTNLTNVTNYIFSANFVNNGSTVDNVTVKNLSVTTTNCASMRFTKGTGAQCSQNTAGEFSAAAGAEVGFDTGMGSAQRLCLQLNLTQGTGAGQCTLRLFVNSSACTNASVTKEYAVGTF